LFPDPDLTEPMSKRPLVSSQRPVEWLEQTAQLLLEGSSRKSRIHSALGIYLKTNFPNIGKFGNRGSTIISHLKSDPFSNGQNS